MAKKPVMPKPSRPRNEREAALAAKPVIEQKEQKVVSFYGIERGDFIYYLAVVFAKAGKLVLVIDNSLSNDVYGAVSNYETGDGKLIRQNIVYMTNVNYKRKEDSPYEIVFIWHGMRLNCDMAAQSDALILLPNYEPNTLRKMSEHINGMQKKVSAVYMRDAVSNAKVKPRTIAGMFGINPQLMYGDIMYDAKDYENYLAFLYNGSQKFSSLSPGFADFIKDVISMVTGLPDKNVIGMYNMAKNASA